MDTTIDKPLLAAEKLRLDQRLLQAKQLILQAVAEHQQTINSVRPPKPELQSAYQEMLDHFGQIRGGSLYFPYLSSGLGNGPFVELADGSVKLDFITGIGVHGFGHSHRLIIEAGIDAALCDTVMQGNLQQNMDSFELVKLLTETANESGAKLQHCFLSTSGAMANENSLKIAFQKNYPANRVIAFDNCFAGRTLALAQMTDKAQYRDGLPDTIAVDYIPFFDANDSGGSTQRTVSKLKDHLHRHPGKHALLWMELIQGEGGYYAGDTDFFKALIAVAHEHNIAVIADEVQTFGRTTRPFAFQHFDLDQLVDLVTIGKVSQVCATLYTDPYRPKPGLISQTFTGSSWAITASLAIVQAFIDNGHFGPHGKNARLHAKFTAGLEAISKKFPGTISGPYGIGGMVAFTFMDGQIEPAKDLIHRMFHAGLMSFMAGSNPVRIRFLIPLGCVEDWHIDLACQIIEQIIGEICSESEKFAK